MIFQGNFVCTTNHEVNVGDIVCYYESLPTCICDCEVLDCYNNESEYGFKLKVVTPITDNTKKDEVFTCSATPGYFAYAGMWRLYNKGEYTSNITGANIREK